MEKFDVKLIREKYSFITVEEYKDKYNITIDYGSNIEYLSLTPKQLYIFTKLLAIFERQQIEYNKICSDYECKNTA